MKLYSCSNCQNPLYFENNYCLNCQHAVGFDATNLELVTLEGGNNNAYYDFATKKISFKYCQNASHATCNWIIPSKQHSPFCPACELNRTIPSLVIGENVERWARIEMAKHRLVYSLLRLKLPLKRKHKEGDNGLAFDFLADVSHTKRIFE